MTGRSQRIFTREEFCSEILAPLAVAINRVQLHLKYRDQDRKKVYDTLTKAFGLIHRAFHGEDFSQTVGVEDLSMAQDFIARTQQQEK